MRRPLAVLLVATCVVVTTAACSSTTTVVGAISPPTVVDTVRRSASAMEKGPYHVQLVNPLLDITSENDVDPVQRLFGLQANSNAVGHRFFAGTRIIGDDVYVFLPTNKWAHFQLSKMRDLSPVNRSFDYEVVHDFLMGVRTATETTPGTYTGDSEIDKMGGALGRGLSLLAPTDTHQLAFEARLDDQARIVYLKYTVPSADSSPPITYTATVSHYGEPISVQPPPLSQVTEATDKMYATY